MAEQWIDAATAAEIVADGVATFADKQALCARAHRGLVKAWAQLLVSTSTGRPDRRVRNVSVPEVFWWAEGHKALEQDWASGDFSTWIDRKVHLQAFGVRFALSGVMEMLPYDRRASIARRLSIAGNEAWVPAHRAIEAAKARLGDSDAGEFILERARLGFVSCRAVEAKRFEERKATELVWEEREWEVPPWFWEPASRLPAHESWELGQFGAQEPPAVGEGWVRVSGLHFLAESLAPMLTPPASSAASEPLSSEPPVKSNAAGRIAQPWWDDMWCNLFALIYQGDFNPESQADVERAMLIWAEQNGQSLAEATARPKARKLFKALKGEATNFLRRDL